MQSLSREELAGVIAHELAHIKKHDTLLMTITATIAGAISMVAQFGMFFGGNRDNNNGPGIVGSIAMMILAPIGAMLVQMAISRTREYAADDLGARIAGQPMWLASALSKIANAAHQVPNIEAERNPATAHMFIIDPLSGRGVDSLFTTHPSTQNRIAALQQLAAEMGARVGTASANAGSNTPRRGPWGRPSASRGPWGGKPSSFRDTRSVDPECIRPHTLLLDRFQARCCASPRNDRGGKSFLIFGNNVKPQNKKYFAFPEGQIRSKSLSVPPNQRGVGHVTNEGGDRGGR